MHTSKQLFFIWPRLIVSYYWPVCFERAADGNPQTYLFEVELITSASGRAVSMLAL
jgi:hypothetical protein